MRKVGKCPEAERRYELVFSDADTTIDYFSLEQILSDIDDGTIIDDIATQRDSDMWAKKSKTLLVHTVLSNLSILPISLVQNGTGGGIKKKLIDGKQRLSTLAQFRNNEFTLSSICPPVKMRKPIMVPKLDEDGNVVTEKSFGKRKAMPVMVPKLDENGNVETEIIDYKIAGKYYDELPDALKKQFCRYKKMPQYTHINYSDEEMQLQMLRDNISVKMTPGQVGAVVCGEELADWQHSFRTHNLFMDNSVWTPTQIRNNCIERCIVEAFVLFISDEENQQWRSNYDKNVEIFKKNASVGMLEAFETLIDNFNNIVVKYPSLKENITINNLHILLAAYSHFCDMDTRYSQDDFGRFLCAWFENIKETTNYETDGNTGTKHKTTILNKLDIIDHCCSEYMRENGHVVHKDELEDDLEYTSRTSCATDTVEKCEEGETTDCSKSEIIDAKIDTRMWDLLRIKGEREKNLFGSKALMIVSNYHYGNFNDDTINKFGTYFKLLTDNEKSDLIETTAFELDCLSSYIENTEKNDFFTEDNVLCLLDVFNRTFDDVEETVFKKWLKDFVSAYNGDCVYANIKENQDNYIMGRISYLYSSLEKYNIKTKERECA